MRKAFNLLLVAVLIVGIFVGAIYLGVPGYIQAYNSESDTEISVEDEDYSQYSGLVEYILQKNANEWKTQTPDGFYTTESVIHITLAKSSYEYNYAMGVLKLGHKTLALTGMDKTIFNLIFGE